MFVSGEGITIPHNGFMLHFPYFKRGRVPFHILISRFNFLFCKMPMHIFILSYVSFSYFIFVGAFLYILDVDVW